ncbi:NADH-ubiquinone oxidoreductase flavoprotein 3 [Trinorchestia longiramus]|nr:NADH-ubiquinone oxidoreductase flavoprotein 3 [Trinorchestia longiramus]
MSYESLENVGNIEETNGQNRKQLQARPKLPKGNKDLQDLFIILKYLGAVGRPSVRCMTGGANTTSGKAPPAAAAASLPPYKSAATPDPGNKTVGPGASRSGDYKCVEYFCYNKTSYFDLEAEMVKDRLPQPSADNGCR